MKICLINPPHLYLRQPKAQAPLGLLYVAACLREKGYLVSYLDLSDKIVTDSMLIPEADVYGITATVLDILSVNRLAKELKRRFKAAVIVGGPATLSPQYFDWQAIDTIVLGEGEEIIFDILRDYPRMGRMYRGKRILDLDSLPFPARDLVEGPLGGGVFAQGKEYYGGESTVISTSRGCPFSCTFCASPKIWNQKIIYRSPESVVEEINEVIEKFNVRQLRFSDDNLTCKRPELEALCKHLGGVGLAWRASIRVTPNDEAMFQLMKFGGCAEVCFGIESGDPDVLRALHKGATIEDNRRAITNAHYAGLDVRILFMIGTPGETTKTVDRNIEFLESVKYYYDAIAITNYTPLPGSAIADDPIKNGCELLETSIEKYNLCLYGPEGQNEWYNHVRPVGLTIEQLTNNKKRMVEYILSTGKANEG